MKQGDHEHIEFEKFAESKKLDRIMHPLHLLYLDAKTSNALTIFKAGYEAGKHREKEMLERIGELELKLENTLLDGAHYTDKEQAVISRLNRKLNA